MRKFIIPILMSFGFASCLSSKFNPSFIGSIRYQYSYNSNILDVDSLRSVRPGVGLFRYDRSSYQSSFVGIDTLTYYYSGRINKCLSQVGNSTSFECEDYGLHTDSILFIKDYSCNEKILGYSCRILEIQKKASWVRYYYATDLHIAKATYKNHRSYNWDAYGNSAKGGLVLKLEHRFARFTMTGIAVEIDKQGNAFKALQITDSLFAQFCR